MPNPIQNITVKGEFIYEIQSKQDWINKCPERLPQKQRSYEQWAWVDKNGNVFLIGEDFSAAEKAATYPCKIYRLQSVADAHNS